MGALLSLPLLAVPSMGTVRHQASKIDLGTDLYSFLLLLPVAVVQLLALQCSAHAVNAETGQSHILHSGGNAHHATALPHVSHTLLFSS
jgi:hypothetical protein